jgi:hypothetical protein
MFPNLGFLGEEVFALLEDPAFGIQFDDSGAAVEEAGRLGLSVLVCPVM